jgi:ribosomal-protein-alanine N-acetyltransferase
MHPATIHTDRLDLVPFTAEFLHASLDGDLATAEELLGVPLPATWPESPDTLARRLRQLEADPSLEPWLLRAIVLREVHTMVGHIGFHEAPGPEHYREIAPGAAEFGYTICGPYRRRGYAREAALALMDWAHREHGVPRFVLTISPDNLPSQALATHLGFVRIGSHIDEVDGLEDILLLNVVPTSIPIDDANNL